MRIISILIIVILTFSYIIADNTQHIYVGAGKCKMCHQMKKYGNQYGIWKNGPHSKAFETLASEKSLKIAAGMGIENPQENEKCLVCHVTAFGVPDSLKKSSFDITDGVGCESCHGPGADYMILSIMKDREKSIAAGLIIPDENTCLICHNENSPTYKPFNYDEKFALIAHPTPKQESDK